MRQYKEFDMLKALVMDIEGTTTSIAFVYEVLFPFARRALPGFLAASWRDVAVQKAIAAMGDGTAQSPDEAWQAAEALMDADVKDTGLKALQGMVWKGGFDGGDIRGHLFDDVAPALHGLHARGVTLAIYSSGSIAAQKLLFGFSVAGDLARDMFGFFDTTTGPKREASSYTAIAATLGLAPETILFVSDHPDEVRAAHDAGFAVRAVVRPGNAPLPDDFTFETITTFDALADLGWA